MMRSPPIRLTTYMSALGTWSATPTGAEKVAPWREDPAEPLSPGSSAMNSLWSSLLLTALACLAVGIAFASYDLGFRPIAETDKYFQTLERK